MDCNKYSIKFSFVLIPNESIIFLKEVIIPSLLHCLSFLSNSSNSSFASVSLLLFSNSSTLYFCNILKSVYSNHIMYSSKNSLVHSFPIIFSPHKNSISFNLYINIDPFLISQIKPTISTI